MNYDNLKAKLEMINDPSFNKPLQEVNGIKKLTIGPTGIVECEIFLKDKQKDETKVKLDIVKLVKVDLKFPGIKVTFFDSEFIEEGKKVIRYIGIASGKGGGLEESKTLGVPLMGHIPIGQPKEVYIHEQGEVFNIFKDIAEKLMGNNNDR